MMMSQNVDMCCLKNFLIVAFSLHNLFQLGLRLARPPLSVAALTHPQEVPFAELGLTAAMLSEPYYHKRLRKQKSIRAHIPPQEHPAAGN